jgi:hypothetical protein
MRGAIRKAQKSAVWRAAAGHGGPVYRKKLYRRFSFITINDGKTVRALRNFSSYGRRSAAVFGPNEKVSQQVKKFERAALRDIANLNAKEKPPI